MREGEAASLFKLVRRYAEVNSVVVNRTFKKHPLNRLGEAKLIRPFMIHIYDAVNRDEEDMLYTLAHELGHVFDVQTKGYLECERQAVIQSNTNVAAMDDYQKAIYYQLEKRAWELGRGILLQLGISELLGYDTRVAKSLKNVATLLELG